ncbi:hypothetical protein ACFX5Q_22580 [Mesorhizobium sp. IMUNJ 23033]|uniref:ATP-dependent DNA ligase n=1 Tax=Mesorhizobium sp. IMUNJ 23033 TaxID=3378039 RepID=UPI00384E8AD6
MNAQNAIVIGEIIVTNEAGLSEFAALRKAITRRQHDLYFVAFDLLHLNGHDLRDMALEDRREILVSMISTGGRIQFSQALQGEAKALSMRPVGRAWFQSGRTANIEAAPRPTG